MARPLKPRTLDSFPHPCSPGHWDHKLEVLEAMHGVAGYALYYKMLELVYQQEDCTLTLDDHMRRILRGRLRVGPRKFDEILDAALEVRLFDPQAFHDGRVITNRTIERTAAATFKRRDAERQRSQKRRETAAGTTPETPRNPASQRVIEVST